MPIAVSLDRNVAAALREQLRDDIVSARETLLEDGARLDKRIHKARRRLKRARTILRALRPLADKAARRLGRELGDIARSLSAARDADVMAGTAERLAGEADGPEGEALRHLAGTLAARAKAVHAELPPIEAAAAGLAQAAVAAVDLVWGKKAGRADVLLAGIETTYRDGRAALAAAAEPGAHDEALHDWRKAVKHRWHLSKLAEPRTAAAAPSVVTALDELGEMLGEEHDLAVLAATVTADPALAGGEAEAGRVVAVVAARRAALQADAFARGRILYEDKPSKFRKRLAEPATLVAAGTVDAPVATAA
ncbi:CHAD domain-containing protein [Pseudoxanthobacter sp. M-2]|uniref:CHAD domain-containing protein n=1 Tax=Pseudoxanthobacter sp. M-2 TaxID=3078754 RepID=UPI0038FC3D07